MHVLTKAELALRSRGQCSEPKNRGWAASLVSLEPSMAVRPSFDSDLVPEAGVLQLLLLPPRVAHHGVQQDLDGQVHALAYARAWSRLNSSCGSTRNPVNALRRSPPASRERRRMASNRFDLPAAFAPAITVNGSRSRE